VENGTVVAAEARRPDQEMAASPRMSSCSAPAALKLANRDFHRTVNVRFGSRRALARFLPECAHPLAARCKFLARRRGVDLTAVGMSFARRVRSCGADSFLEQDDSLIRWDRQRLIAAVEGLEPAGMVKDSDG